MNINKRKTYFVWLLFVLIVFSASCGAPGGDNVDSITQGEIHIVVDETLKEPFETGVYNFEQINKDAKINIIALPEQQAFMALKEDSIRVLIATRDLTDEEKRYFEKIKITPRMTPLGYEAISLLCQKGDDKSQIGFEQLGQYLKGEIPSPYSVDHPLSDSKTILVFSGSGAGTMSTLKEIFEIEEFGCEIFALESPEGVVEYISKNKLSVGVLGMSWINSLDRLKTQEFQERIGLIAISNPSSEMGGYFLPDQTSIGDKSYPLSRTIMGISREARVGLGTGFISFMASERGQRIILKSGLLPYTMPSRDLIIYDNEYKIEKD